MAKQVDWAHWCVVFAVLFILLGHPGLSAQPHPSPGQSDAQKKDVDVPAPVAPPDSITVPDGTPLPLRLETELNSATAKVGDTIEFTTHHRVRINELVIVPKGAAVSGTVVQVTRPRRRSRDGQVNVAVEKLVLPSGELATLRPQMSASKKSGRRPVETASDGGDGLWFVLRAPFDPLMAPIVPFILAAKGHEQAYPAGTSVTVYFNGPLYLNRSAVMKLQPPPIPYRGPAQVFFRNLRKDVAVFCGHRFAGDLYYSLRLELNPGTYSFSTNKTKEQAAQLEVQENHQYWIERDRGGLFVKDSQQHLLDIEEFETSPGMIGKDFTSLSAEGSCGHAALP